MTGTGAKPLVVDVHAHHVPRALLDALDEQGAAVGIEVQRAGSSGAVAFRLGDHVTRPLDARLLDLDDRLVRMDRAGVDVQVLSLWTDLVGYELDLDAALLLARTCNDLLAAVVAEHGPRFLALATVPLQHPEAAVSELRRAVRSLGLVGAELAASLDGPALGDPVLDPFWEAAEELGCLLLVHPFGGLCHHGLEPAIETLVGRPAETAIALTPLIAAGVLERFPQLRICVAHGGGFLPYQIGRLQRAHRVALARGEDSVDPRASLRRLYFDTVLNSPGALRYLIDEVGVEQLMLGSDDPFEGGDPTPVDSVGRIPGLSERERALIVGGNVARVLTGLTDLPAPGHSPSALG